MRKIVKEAAVTIDVATGRLIIMQPTSGTLFSKLVMNAQEIRWFIGMDDGEFYVWAAHAAIHREVMQKLGYDTGHGYGMAGYAQAEGDRYMSVHWYNTGKDPMTNPKFSKVMSTLTISLIYTPQSNPFTSFTKEQVKKLNRQSQSVPA